MDIITLIPQFGGLIYTVLAFVIALSIIVAVHEYGHYIVGRWSGIHPEVFSLGFGPVIWSRVDKRGTRWQIAALPFGGYVRFMGDANAASGKDDAVTLTPPKKLSLEQAIAYITDDELVEVTPNYIRLRKRHLDPHERKRQSRKAEAELAAAS